MSETPPTRACGTDVAAYALGALEPAEAEAFRRHLEGCSVCRDELTAFQQVVNTLPLDAEQYRAPESLRRRVLAAPEAEPKAQAAAEPQAQAQPPRERRWRRGLLVPRPVLALGAITLVAAVAVAAISLSSSSSSTRVYQAQVSGVIGTAQVRVTDGNAVLVVRNFSPPPAGKIYQVWLARGTRPPQPTPALFSVNTSGAGDVDVPGSLNGVDQVLVTPEPAGGSQAPTHAPVIDAKLS
jgi:anti-sigma factor RsiW